MTLSVKDLKGAAYNPRVISDKRLRALQSSYETYGDLSGVVFNKSSRVLVSGHQRLKTLAGKKTRIVTTPHVDSYGTVAIGHIEVQSDKGVSKIPIRIVQWSDKKVEMAANIAANAHGGDFDRDKLRAILAKLDDKTFDIELTGLDPLLIRSLAIPQKEADGTGTTGGQSTGFPEFDENSFSHDVCCPKCGYGFNPAEPKQKTINVKAKVKVKK